MFKTIFLLGIACLCVQQIFAATFQEQCLAAHNKYREMHGVPNLTSDSAITKFAQEWADNLAKTGKFEHRPNNKYGENIYAMFGSGTVTCDMAVKAWYDEIKDYNYNAPGFGMETGHFTQVVWKNSKNLGCAIAKKGTNNYVVCNYSPPGNFEGQFPANVLKKK